MKESIITATMIVCGLVLTIIVGVGKFAVDKTAPVISLEGKTFLLSNSKEKQTKNK